MNWSYVIALKRFYLYIKQRQKSQMILYKSKHHSNHNTGKAQALTLTKDFELASKVGGIGWVHNSIGKFIIILYISWKQYAC